MNRKSLYYHCKDKYDLVNWIYYTECVAVLKEKDYCTEWELLEDLCAYFYKNRTFYRKTLSVDGQNSFSEYFRDILAAILAETMEGILGQDPHLDFYVEFYTDAFLCALKRWLLAKTKGRALPPGRARPFFHGKTGFSFFTGLSRFG